MTLTPLILAGGSGTRLWPVSRDGMPKQFLPLVGERSTYQQALARVSDPALFAPPIVITNEAFRFFALQQAEELGLTPTVVLEPARRDSAAAIAAGAAVAAQRDPDAMVLAMAADHVILDEDAVPRRGARPRAGRRRGRAHRHLRHPPDRAQDRLRLYPPRRRRSRRTGCSRSRPSSRSRMRRRRRTMSPRAICGTPATSCSAPTSWPASSPASSPTSPRPPPAAADLAKADGAFLRLDAEAFGRAPRISIDYAVMEKTDTAAVVESTFRWSDIGSWDAVFAMSTHDEAGNVAVGRGRDPRLQGLPRPFRPRADGDRRGREPGGGDDARRRAGGRPRALRGRQGAGGPARRGPPRGPRAPPRLPPVGLL